MLFYNAGALRFAAFSASLLVGQFAVVWIRVLPHLHETYGPESTFYRLFLYLGMPFGMFFLDFLMFLEPFGLLPITPMPETLRQFIPSYKATRIIAEVAVEAFVPNNQKTEAQAIAAVAMTASGGTPKTAAVPLEVATVQGGKVGNDDPVDGADDDTKRQKQQQMAMIQESKVEDTAGVRQSDSGEEEMLFLGDMNGAGREDETDEAYSLRKKSEAEAANQEALVLRVAAEREEDFGGESKTNDHVIVPEMLNMKENI